MTGSSKHTASAAAPEPAADVPVGLGWSAAAVPLPVSAVVPPAPALGSCLAPTLGRREPQAQHYHSLAVAAE